MTLAAGIAQEHQERNKTWRLLWTNGPTASRAGTGLELFYDPDRNPTNLELLQEAQEIAREVGRPLATHQTARELYGIK